MRLRLVFCGAYRRWVSNAAFTAARAVVQCFDESHAAEIKHAVIAIEKTIGRIKR
jgi:hypothetical protein